MGEMTFGERGLAAKISDLEVKDYLYLAIGAGAYYYFAKSSLHPRSKEAAAPLGQASYAGSKFLSALLFFQALRKSGLADWTTSWIATVLGVAGLEWYIRKEHPALPPAVGWHHGWGQQHGWGGQDGGGDWDDQQHHHHHGWR